MKNFRIKINGPSALRGSVSVSGSKNAALPELAATILSRFPVVLEGVPDIEDIRAMINALQKLGSSVKSEKNRVELSLNEVTTPVVSSDISKTSRASILILGPLLARNGYAKVALPGGCDIGDRRINYHLDGLKKMGAEIDLESDPGYIIASASKLNGVDYLFPGKTVTGTENLMMAAAAAEGETILKNCATEPEISDLAIFLNSMGAEISGIGTEVIKISGKKDFHSTTHSVIPDRIEAGTYLIASCFEGNDLKVENCNPAHLKSLTDILEKAGFLFSIGEKSIFVLKRGSEADIHVDTEPFPGFPTDLQAQLTTLLTQITGKSTIRENIFNNRFRHVIELNKMGADIEISGNKSIINGKTALNGSYVRTTDLRASASLVLAGLVAKGETVIENSFQLFRGYEKIDEKLNSVGAEIVIMRS